jgi:protein-S-isoprenylcysteine O-methyltransferase Ste14
MTKDHPGVYLPPPMIYAAIFLISVFLQKQWPIDHAFFNTTIARLAGYFLVALTFLFLLPALTNFFLSKNTLVTVKPAHSLQTNGIYAMTRNPMYLGLVLLYTGLALLAGNWWTILFIPMLLLIIQGYIIKREEKYLLRAFGDTYKEYTKRVRRWI